VHQVTPLAARRSRARAHGSHVYNLRVFLFINLRGDGGEGCAPASGREPAAVALGSLRFPRLRFRKFRLDAASAALHPHATELSRELDAKRHQHRLPSFSHRLPAFRERRPKATN